MSFLTKQDIINAPDRVFDEVEVPEWGGKVRIASFTADQALRYGDVQRLRSEGKSSQNPLTLMLVMCIVDENGNQLFDEKDLEALGKRSTEALLRVVKAVREINKTKEGNDPKADSASQQGG